MTLQQLRYVITVAQKGSISESPGGSRYFSGRCAASAD